MNTGAATPGGAHDLGFAANNSLSTLCPIQQFSHGRIFVIALFWVVADQEILYVVGEAFKRGLSRISCVE